MLQSTVLRISANCLYKDILSINYYICIWNWMHSILNYSTTGVFKMYNCIFYCFNNAFVNIYLHQVVLPRYVARRVLGGVKPPPKKWSPPKRNEAHCSFGLGLMFFCLNFNTIFDQLKWGEFFFSLRKFLVQTLAEISPAKPKIQATSLILPLL